MDHVILVVCQFAIAFVILQTTILIGFYPLGYAIGFVILQGYLCYTRTVKALHSLQLDSYHNQRLLAWYFRDPLKRFFHLKLILLGVFFTLSTVFLGITFDESLIGGFEFIFLWVCLWFGLAIPVEKYYRFESVESKKPIVYTARAKRILILSLFLLACCSFPLCLLELDFPHISFLGSVLLYLAVPFFVVLANILLIPVQKAINYYYIYNAKRKLKRIHPKVIGITGSYGKTSTKFFLHTVLEKHFKTLKTPASFNTILGLCKVINNDMQEDTEIFIAEMGAYLPGNIKELCDLAKPDIGIITAVGPMHLERFKTIENIQKTKFELIEAIPDHNLAVFNCDNPYVEKMAEWASNKKIIRYGFGSTAIAFDIKAEEIEYNEIGLKFIVKVNYSNKLSSPLGKNSPEAAATPTTQVLTQSVQTKLLGKHNISNLLGVIAVAYELGMGLEEIAKRILEIDPVPHRLQLIKGSGGVNVIDDSFNSNPEGSTEALNVLAEFKTGRRVIVTPGMVELGSRQVEDNKKLGRHAAQICDLVILVGIRQTEPVYQGLLEAGYDTKKIVRVSTLEEARVELGKFLRAGDSVLFENDLPDLYSEK